MVEKYQAPRASSALLDAYGVPSLPSVERPYMIQKLFNDIQVKYSSTVSKPHYQSVGIMAPKTMTTKSELEKAVENVRKSQVTMPGPTRQPIQIRR